MKRQWRNALRQNGKQTKLNHGQQSKLLVRPFAIQQAALTSPVAAFMIVVPLSIGFLVSRLVAEPVFHVVESFNAEAFAPTDKQKVQGAHRVQVEEMRLRMEEAVGYAPPLSDYDLFKHLVMEAGRLGEQMEEENKRALLNVISDSVSGIVFVVLLAYMQEARRVIMQTTNRLVGGLSESAKVRKQ